MILCFLTNFASLSVLNQSNSIKLIKNCHWCIIFKTNAPHTYNDLEDSIQNSAFAINMLFNQEWYSMATINTYRYIYIFHFLIYTKSVVYELLIKQKYKKITSISPSFQNDEDVTAGSLALGSLYKHTAKCKVDSSHTK